MDFERIYLLLSVAEKAAGHPKLKNILVAAQAELDVIANPPVEPIQETEEESELDSSEPSPGPLSSEPPVGDAPSGRRV